MNPRDSDFSSMMVATAGIVSKRLNPPPGPCFETEDAPGRT
jgi:hypothetical protein